MLCNHRWNRPIRRVNFYVDPEAEQAGFDKMTSILKVHMKDGRVLTGRAQFAKGSPANPMTYDEVADKFRGCADFAKWPRQRAEAVIELVKEAGERPGGGFAGGDAHELKSRRGSAKRRRELARPKGLETSTGCSDGLRYEKPTTCKGVPPRLPCSAFGTRRRWELTPAK